MRVRGWDVGYWLEYSEVLLPKVLHKRLNVMKGVRYKRVPAAFSQNFLLNCLNIQERESIREGGQITLMTAVWAIAIGVGQVMLRVSIEIPLRIMPRNKLWTFFITVFRGKNAHFREFCGSERNGMAWNNCKKILLIVQKHHTSANSIASLELKIMFLKVIFVLLCTCAIE
jgi:hypothetical protein